MNIITKKISYIQLLYNNECVIIKKERNALVYKLFYYFLPIIFFLIAIPILIGQSPNFLKKSLKTETVFLLIIGGILFVIHLYFKVKRSYRVFSNFKLCKNDVLYINDKPVQQQLNQITKIFIVVQDVGAPGGIGGTYTIGIANDNKFYGLCYELSKEHAEEIAKFISENLSYEIQFREAVFFPLYKLH